MNYDTEVKKLKKHHNEMCLLYDTDICRLVGFVDGGMDYYYLIRTRAGKVMLASAVGRILPLKNILPDDNYQRMDEDFERNTAGKVEKFIHLHTTEDGKLCEGATKEEMELFEMMKDLFEIREKSLKNNTDFDRKNIEDLFPG